VTDPIDIIISKLAELTDEQVAKVLSELGKDEVRLIEMKSRAARASRNFTPLGFRDFYKVIWGRDLPPYANEWVESFMSGEWTILECFRGSTKSTTLTTTFSLFCLGHEPWSSVLIVQANDEAASNSTKLMAGVIEHFRGWKMCFPHVVPDKEKGWGANGYFLKDERVENYGDWLEKCSKDHLRDPSFVGYGVSSGSAVGMHPRRLFFDDIHDLKNSAYSKDRKNVVETVQANIIPTITKAHTEDVKPFIGVACTFWDEDDAYHVLLDTGLFTHKKTPILRFDPLGSETFEGEKCKLTWEAGFPMSAVEELRKNNSKAEFARMYLCDLSAAKERMFQYYSYPASEIDYKQPMVGGVDYASVFMPTSGTEGTRSHFAMAYGVKLKTGGAVIADGIVEQISQAQAESLVIRAQNAYPGWLNTVIESDGVGSQFIQLLQRNPDMRVIPMRTSDIFRGKKETRQYEILSPLFERGALRISDGDSKFLRILRNYLERYPNLDHHAPEWDVADSVVWCVMGMPEIHSLSQTIGSRNIITPKKRVSMWSALGNV